MKQSKPSAIVTSLRDPKPLCCQHCFAYESLIPGSSTVEPLFGPMGLHLDLMHLDTSHEMPRELHEGIFEMAIRLVCHNQACQKITFLVITAGANGTFLQLVAGEEDEEENAE